MKTTSEHFYERLTRKEKEIMALQEHVRELERAIEILMAEASERIGSEELIKSPGGVVLDRVKPKLPHKAEDFAAWYQEYGDDFDNGSKIHKDYMLDAFNAGISYAQGAKRCQNS